MSNPELETALNAINDQVAQCSVRWKIYCQLFMSGAANVELLNKSGSTVFRLLQQLIVDDVFMSLSKLTDPATSGRYENKSLTNVVEKAISYLSATTTSEVKTLFDKLAIYVENIRVHRNKILAHADLSYTLKPSRLPDVTYDEVENAMRILQEIVTKVASEACSWTIQTHDVIIPFGTGGDALLRILEQFPLILHRILRRRDSLRTLAR